MLKVVVEIFLRLEHQIHFYVNSLANGKALTIKMKEVVKDEFTG